MERGVWCLGIVISLTLLISNAAALEISEIMYNPSTDMGDDSDLEWVELYNDGDVTINLTNFTINRKPFEDTEISPGEYILIARELIDGPDADEDSFEAYYGNNDAVWGSYGEDYTVVDSSAELKNTEDTINLTDGVINIIIHYLDDYGGDGNGKSICLFNNSWQECSATPGWENAAGAEGELEEPEEADGPTAGELNLSVYLDSEIYLNQIYTQLFRIEIEDKPNCTVKDNVTVAYRITADSSTIKEDRFAREIGCSAYSSTGEFTPLHSGNYSLCGEVVSSTLNQTTATVCQDFSVIDASQVFCNLSLNISTNKTRTYQEGESIKFTSNLNEETFPYFIEYWIEDLFGLVYKAKINTTNTNQKSWQTKIEEEDRILLIKSRVYPTCLDSNVTDNFAEEMFFVLDEISSGTNNLTGSSTLTIEELNLGSDNQAEWGSQFTAKIKVYKGDESKYSVQLWAEKKGKKVSPITKFNVYDKYKEYVLTLPLQLDSNCNNKIDDGDAVLVLEGLGLRDEDEFTIEGINIDLCDNEARSGSGNSQGKKSSTAVSYQVVELPASVNSGGVLRVKVQLVGDYSEHDYNIWSYLYRGSKCYSCLEGKAERESNLQQVQLQENEVKTVEFLMKLDQIKN